MVKVVIVMVSIYQEQSECSVGWNQKVRFPSSWCILVPVGILSCHRHIG